FLHDNLVTQDFQLANGLPCHMSSLALFVIMRTKLNIGLLVLKEMVTNRSKFDEPPLLPLDWRPFGQRCDDTSWKDTCLCNGQLLGQIRSGRFLISGFPWLSFPICVSRHFHCSLEQVPPMNTNVRRRGTDPCRRRFRPEFVPHSCVQRREWCPTAPGLLQKGPSAS